MTTPLHSTLKRALTINGREYVLTLTESALKLTLKGKRNGVELSWDQLVTGEAALAVALHASVGAFAGKNAVRTTGSAKSEAPRTVRGARPASKTLPKKTARGAAKKPLAPTRAVR